VIKLLVSGVARPPQDGWCLVGPFNGADLPVDLSQCRLPLADGSVDAVFVHRALEFIAPQHLPAVLRELRRVTLPGGLLDSADGSNLFQGGLVRIVTPDLAAAVRAFTERDDAFFGSADSGLPDPHAPLGAKLAAWFYGSGEPGAKRHVFDHEGLLFHLKHAGFDGMYRSAFRKSLRPDLRGDGLDVPASDVLFVECWTQSAAARRAA